MTELEKAAHEAAGELCGRHQRLVQALTAARVSTSQFRALAMLSEGTRTMTEIGKEIALTMGAATNVADQLVAQGLVGRERPEADRRVVKLRITPAGRVRLTEACSRVAEALSAPAEVTR